nr:MAG TPA: hypothetical protein [Caudoviricetes sp.]
MNRLVELPQVGPLVNTSHLLDLQTSLVRIQNTTQYLIQENRLFIARPHLRLHFSLPTTLLCTIMILFQVMVVDISQMNKELDLIV